MLDIHTHILPGMDDGSKNVQQSLAMLHKEASQGVDRVVLSSHFYPDRESPEMFLRRRQKALAVLREGTANVKALPEMIPGAEVAFFTGISRTDSIEGLCIDGTRAMLIEMPFCRWNRNILDEVSLIKDYRGIRPIIAHVERYMQYQPLGTIGDLCDSGIWIQTNASFFQNWRTSWLAIRMLKKGMIHFIGSDCHDIERRPPSMDDAIDEISIRLGEQALMHLERMERLLLEGE